MANGAQAGLAPHSNAEPPLSSGGGGVGAVLFSVRSTSKGYPGVQALESVSLDFRVGEVHGLVGENGAGKSTLVKILTGDEAPDSGELHWQGEKVVFRSPQDARRHGIVGIFQELALVPWMSVAENVVLGQEFPLLGRRFGVNHRAAVKRSREVFKLLNVDIDPTLPVAALSPAECQFVEIARALVADAPAIAMDEPTSSLGRADVDTLLGIVSRLRDMGRTILFVSHKLDEVLAVADRVSVMRGGRLVSTLVAEDADEDRLIQLMVGRTLDEFFPVHRTALGAPVLEVNGLYRKGLFEGIDLTVREGQVLGLAGLVGARRTEVVRCICGVDSPDAGEIRLCGKPLVARGPKDAIERGVVYLPEDRKQLGLILSMSGYENAALPSLDQFARPFVSHDRIRQTVNDLCNALRIRGNLARPVRTLSGGNQQKIVLAKWLLKGAKVVVLDEPTRGIDIGAKREVYELINELAASGVGIVLVSSELPELLHMADEIVVMSAGRIYGHFGRKDFDEEKILQAAFAGHTVRHQRESRA